MRALILGAAGQDGYYLTELLLRLGYEVAGVVRSIPKSTVHEGDFYYTKGDITDSIFVNDIISEGFDEVYNLAAQSHVSKSFEAPAYTFNSVAIGCSNVLEAIRTQSPTTKFYQASSSEMFGNMYSVNQSNVNEIVKFQDEQTRMVPESPYAVAKLAAHNLVHIYRECYGIFACSGILHNHESPLRGEGFVTRKITKWIGEFINWKDELGIKCHDMHTDDSSPIVETNNGKYIFNKLRLGNIDVCRDWGHAADYVEAMYSMMQYSRPDDYVIATGISHSIKEFVECAFNVVGISDPFKYIIIDKSLYRPSDVSYLLGNASKAKIILNWEPRHTFSSLVKEMVEADLEKARKKERSWTKSASIKTG